MSVPNHLNLSDSACDIRLVTNAVCVDDSCKDGTYALAMNLKAEKG